MFESNPSFQHPDSDVDLSTPDTLSIESILLKSNLPKDVRNAPATQIFERLMDAKEIARLTKSHQPQKHDLDYLERLRVRRRALSANKDSMLICVVIRLPGVMYTIEIDPVAKAIVHWEWQRA